VPDGVDGGTKRQVFNPKLALPRPTTGQRTYFPLSLTTLLASAALNVCHENGLGKPDSESREGKDPPLFRHFSRGRFRHATVHLKVSFVREK
jgi:hypothetical protein